MSWRVIKRKLGPAGSLSMRLARQRDWNEKYGEGHWAVGYIYEEEFISSDEAIDLIYNKSYEQHFLDHPNDLDELITTAKALTNPHADAGRGVDLQVPAIRHCLKKWDLRLKGRELVDIGTWQNKASHPISVRLSPLQVKALGHPKWTLEKFWQRRKVLALWENDPESWTESNPRPTP